MTVLFLTRLFYPHIGGVETHVFEVSERLGSLGHKIIVVTEQYQKNLKKKDIVDGIEIYRIPVGENEWVKKFRIWWWLFNHRYLIKKADIVHAHDVFFWYLPFRFLYPQERVFTTFHGYETQFPPSKKAVLVRKIGEKLSKGNICVGEYIKKWYGTKPNYTTYGGVEILNIKYKIVNIKNRKLRILFIGRLDEDIGIKLYLDALDKLKKKIKFEITFLGRGKYENQVTKYGRVVVPSHYNNTYHYSEALLGVDIVFASSYLSILTAMAAKKPVFAVYDNPLKKDYLKMAPFAKWIFISGDPRLVADKIYNHYSGHETDSENKVNKAYNWAKKQTWEKVVNLYLKVWQV